MEEALSARVGARIRMFRKARHLTLQELADRIHKSRATMSKYENGEIVVDIDTLYDISCALMVPMNQLTDIPLPQSNLEQTKNPEEVSNLRPEAAFFKANRLYFYFYDGRYGHVKDGVISIGERNPETGDYNCTLSICIMSGPEGRASELYYTGKVLYSDMLIRFSFINTCNKLEEALLYIFNPLEQRDQTTGLLCSISTADLVPCAFKCLVTLQERENTPAFRSQLLFTDAELQTMKHLNRLLVTNI